MAPQVKKAKTAFSYFQTDSLSKIRAELGQGATMGDAMTEVSTTYNRRPQPPLTSSINLDDPLQEQS